MQALRKQALAAGLIAALLPVAAEDRSAAAKAEFRRQAPCPATQQAHGPCSGWVIDHVVPLACGGVDHPSNMQWQTKADAAAKDRDERRGCQKPPGLRGM